MKIQVTKPLLQANDKIANENREAFLRGKVFSLNLISSPGSGKTTLLEKTIPALGPKEKTAVIVGDLETARDAERLSLMSGQVTQINTGMSCHLYANQIAESIKSLECGPVDYLFIENVGNMVCPGEFDLGENRKVILYSIPEGDDKAAKYPTIFRAADIVLLTKIDLMGVLRFDLKRVYDDIAKLNNQVKIIHYSSWTGEGFDVWIQWLKDERMRGLGDKAKSIQDHS